VRGARAGEGEGEERGTRGCYVLFSVSVAISESVKRRDNRQ
jgi:hypothetical protein